jgi:3-methyladenine DNA glycosylase AlkD
VKPAAKSKPARLPRKRSTFVDRSPKPTRQARAAPGASIALQVERVLTWLKAHSSEATLNGMSRYAIPSHNAFGVAMKDIKALGKELGHNHELALALWKTDRYEARILTAFVADPAQLTADQMDAWCRDFDNWAYCDTLSFSLFDRTPHAWQKVERWSRSKGEFEKRTAFALLWSLALHDKLASDDQFIEGLGLIERASDDERNFVKKAVSMALKAIGKRNRTLRAAAITVAGRLAESPQAAARSIGKETLRELKAR